MSPELELLKELNKKIAKAKTDLAEERKKNEENKKIEMASLKEFEEEILTSLNQELNQAKQSDVEKLDINSVKKKAFAKIDDFIKEQKENSKKSPKKEKPNKEEKEEIIIEEKEPKKTIDFLNLNLVDLNKLSDKEVKALHKEGHYFWQLHEAGKLKDTSDVEYVIHSHVLIVQEMTKRKLEHGLGSNLDFISEKLFPGYSKSETSLLFDHEKIHQEYAEEAKEDLIALHMDSELALMKSGYGHIDHSDKLDQYYDKVMKKLESVDEIEVPASTFNYWVVKEFLDCKIKDVFANSISISKPKMGTFLKACKEIMKEYNVLDTRNFTNDGRESPPKSKIIKLNSSYEEDFLIDGMQFLENQLGQRHIAKFDTTWSGFEFTLISRSVFKELNKTLINKVFQWMKDNDYLKNEKFTLGGEFLKPSEKMAWDDIKVRKDLKNNLLRINELIKGDKEKKFSRGLLFIGPPGTGKTFSLKMLMKDADSTFIWVTAKDLGHMGSSNAIGMGFELARELAPTILCFEDIDTYISAGSIDLFKTELDGLIANEGVTTILTTNYPEQLPPALLDRPGRFHDICNFDLPDSEIRLEMVHHLTEEDLKSETIKEVVKETEGFSGAHMSELVSFAKRIMAEKECTLDEAFLESLTKLKNQKELVQTILENKGR